MKPLSTEHATRRSQRERSETMQRRILDATLQSLGETGYSFMSLQEIAARAGVSRGAITHHYVSRLDLTAEAIRYFVRWRQDQIAQAFQKAEPKDLSERLEVLWTTFQMIFPVTLEIVMALRSDKKLKDLFSKRKTHELDAIAQDYENFFPEFSGINLPSSIVSMIVAFYRGLYFDSITRTAAHTAEVKREFEKALRDILTDRNILSSDVQRIRIVAKS